MVSQFPPLPLTDNQLTYRQYIASPVWKAKRQEALAFYGCICNRCKQHGTDVHHKTYDRVGGQELMEDLEILCRPCHEAHHRLERLAKSSKRKTPKRTGINRTALYRYLTSGQKQALMSQFGLSKERDLFSAMSTENREDVNAEATKMVGYNFSFPAKGPSHRGGTGKADQLRSKKRRWAKISC